ncbi:MAG TPA: hypothetical protein VGN70_11635 [Gammaproteobacteria bacterium]
MRKLTISMLAVSSLGIAAAAFAADTTAPTSLGNGPTKGGYNGFADQELSTAVNHADQAKSAKDITAVHEHLHEVLNCLVGPAGTGFDTGTSNPCQRMGRGAVLDVQQGSDETRLINDAINQAKSALNDQNVSSAKSTSKTILNELEQAENSLKQ